MSRPRNSDLVPQLYNIIRNEKPLTVPQLARRVNVSERTMHRLINHMRDRGIDVRYSRDLCGFVIRDQVAQIAAGYLSQSEGTALAVAAQLAASLTVPFSYSLDGASRHIADILMAQMRVDVAPTLQPLKFTPAPSRRVRPEVLEHLSRACAGGETIEMTYYSASRDVTSHRLFDPYIVEMRGTDWYAIGHCHLRNRVLVFAASRMKNLRTTPHRFERPPDFDVGEHFRNALGVIASDLATHVVVEFTAHEARWVAEREWHASQRVESLPSGGIRVHLDVAMTVELRRWILGYGAAARVVAPPELAADIAAELRQARENYSD